MDKKRKINPRDTYIFDDDVMDELENFETTSVLDDTALRWCETHGSDEDGPGQD
jgi:hypothetical protein